MSLTKSRMLAAKKLIGRRILAIRKARGLTQIDVATRVEKNQGVVSGWERGERLLTYPDAWKLAVALGVPIEDLVGPPKGAREVQFFDATVQQYEHPVIDDDPELAAALRRPPPRR